jgi:DnaJ-class molecular chaperone
MNTELYDILGVQPNATTDEIKKAYKKAALKSHPDKCPDQSAPEQFQKINRAHEILSNPEKREIYDRYGLGALDEQQGPSFDPFGGMGGMGPMGPMGPFAQFFRQAAGHTHTHFQQVEKILRAVTLEEIFTQTKITVSVPRKIKCPKCLATGFKDKQAHWCVKCRGVGVVTQRVQRQNMIFQTQIQCDACRGSKKDNSEATKCKKCIGSGMIEEDHGVEIDLPRDILKENIVHVKEGGSWHNNGYADLAISLNLDMSTSRDSEMGPNKFYLGSNKILTYEMHISLSESICGFVEVINHPSGKKIYIQSDPGCIINPNTIYILDNLGLQSKYDVLPLHLEFVIHYPEKIVIPNSKKLAFTYNNLEKILGDKLSSDSIIMNETNTQLFNLNLLNKIDSPKYRFARGPDFEPNYEEEEGDYAYQNGQSNIHPQCAQQ